MSSRCWLLGVCLMGSVAAAPVCTASSASVAPDVKTASAKDPLPPLLRDIPQLQQKVTLEATDRPVGDVLTDLSQTLWVDLSAERNIADQRITLHLEGQPVYALMDRLVRLLSHHLDTRKGYYWNPLERPRGTRLAFQMWRDERSVNEEESALDYPQREIVALLRDLRNSARLPRGERAKYKGEYPYQLSDDNDDLDNLPYTKAFSGLTDDQIDALAAGQSLPLNPALFASEIAAMRQRQPEVPLPIPSLTVRPYDEDLNYSWVSTDKMGKYLVSLQGVLASLLILDTYDTTSSRSPFMVSVPPVSHPASGTVIDLAPLLSAKTVTRAEQTDVGFTLQALAKTAHISLYQEDFLRTSPEREPTDAPSVGLAMRKGTVPALLDAVCAHWNYCWQKVGSDYLVWSRTWALDRAGDVPERLIVRWRKRIIKQGGPTLNDRAEIAAALNPRQIGLTLDATLPEAGQWSHSTYPMYRFLGQLSPLEEDAVFSDAGLNLGSLSPWKQNAFAEDFQQHLANVSSDQLSRAVMTAHFGEVGDPAWESVTMSVKADDQTLFGTLDSVLRPPLPQLSFAAKR